MRQLLFLSLLLSGAVFLLAGCQSDEECLAPPAPAAESNGQSVDKSGTDYGIQETGDDDGYGGEANDPGPPPDIQETGDDDDFGGEVNDPGPPPDILETGDDDEYGGEVNESIELDPQYFIDLLTDFTAQSWQPLNFHLDLSGDQETIVPSGWPATHGFRVTVPAGTVDNDDPTRTTLNLTVCVQNTGSPDVTGDCSIYLLVTDATNLSQPVEVAFCPNPDISSAARQLVFYTLEDADPYPFANSAVLIDMADMGTGGQFSVNLLSLPGMTNALQLVLDPGEPGQD